MICKNVKQLLQVALRNAIPMHSQGYTAVPSPYLPHAFMVNKPEIDESGNPIGYDVSTKFNLCNCEFYKANKPYFPNECTCKHIEFARSCEEENARIDAMIEASDARELDRAEAENFQIVNRADREYQDACHGVNGTFHHTHR